MTVIIDGRRHAASLRAEVAIGTARFADQHGARPALATIFVGDDPASAIYVRRKVEQAEEAGIRSLSTRLPADTQQDELLALIERLNRDPAVHGILVQLPLPSHLDPAPVLAAIDPAKDVDGFHEVNVGRLTLARPGLAPCTPTGCMMLLRAHLPDLAGLHAVVVGCSNVVGRPMAEMLLRDNCTVSIAHVHTTDLPALVGQADILVVAAGVPGLIRGTWLKPGAVVIDVGINRVVDAETGKSRIVGDVRFDEALDKAGAISPVPGGVGPMTIACLLRNTLEAARMSRLTVVAAG